MEVDGVDVTLVTDDETVTSVVDVCDVLLLQEPTYTIDAARTRATASGPPFATLRADALVDTISPPKRRYVQAHIPALQF
jgi:hypothetical protein